MDSDAPPVVNLEVTVPRIVLTAKSSRSGQMEALATKQQSASSEEEVVEEVRLLPLESQQNTSLHQHREQQRLGMGDVSRHTIRSIRFRVFRFPVLAGAQPFLLQVLRKYNRYIGKRRWKWINTKENNGGTVQLIVTDAAAFSVEFRQFPESAGVNTAASSSVPGPTTPSSIFPTLNQVVIYLDNEGTPANYSIDGAES